MYGETDALHWLRDDGCPWFVSEVCMRAARIGATDILDYVIEQGEVLDAELLTTALNKAGVWGQLLAAQWLRQHAAEWPAVLLYGQASHIKQWHAHMIVWARAQGCTAPTTL
jgi:hypothetical protein